MHIFIVENGVEFYFLSFSFLPFFPKIFTFTLTFTLYVYCFSWRNVRLYVVRHTLFEVMVVHTSEHVVPLEQPKENYARQNETSVL